VAYPLLSSGTCRPCRTGHRHVCKTLKLIWIDRDGGMAGYAWIVEDVLINVPDTLSDAATARVEPLAVVVRSVHQARFNLLDRGRHRRRADRRIDRGRPQAFRDAPDCRVRRG